MLTTAPSATDRFLAELRAARDDAALSEVNPDGSLDPYESASFVINNLAAIRYALGSGMPVIAWQQALKNEAGSEYVLRSVRQFQEQAMLLVLAYTSGTIALDTFRTALVREFRQQARNSYIAGRRAMGDLSALDRDNEAALDALVDDDASDLADGMDVGPDVTGAVAGGSLIGAIGSMIFDPSNFLGSGLPGDPFANLPAPIGAGKHAASDAAKHTATAALKGTVSPTAKAASDAAMATYGKAMAGYADRIRAVSHAGELSALAGLPGDATLVWWNLGAADHCIDCIRLADASPFYVSAFSATGIYPGSGHTRCLLPGTEVAGAFTGGQRMRYQGEIVHIETARGRRLSVTPNHPVLTLAGFAPAGVLREGDELLCDAVESKEHRRVWRDEAVHEDHGPTAIEQVFRALDALPSTIAGKATRSTEDFHGDAAAGDGDIDVVRPLSELLNNGHAPTCHLGREIVLVAASQRERVLSGQRATTRLSDADASPAIAAMGRGQQGRAVMRARPAHTHVLALGAIANLDVRLDEPAGECAAADARLVRELQERGAGLVSRDRIVKIERRNWGGHVYDLATAGGWFSADGVIVANCGGACRCSLDYDLPSQVCGDTLADDLGGLVESVNRQTPDGTRLNVWLQEAVSCNLPINVDALQAAEDYSVIDDESAFSWDDDVASMIGGSVEEDTVTWAEVVGKVLPYQQGARMRRAFEQIAAEVPPADLRLTRYTTNSTEYVAAWHQSGSSIIFDVGFTTAGPTVFDADYTLHALGDLAAYARLSGRDLSIRGDYAGKGLQGWLNALGTPQQVLPGSAPTIPIDWTKLPAPAEVVPAAVTEPNPALVQMLADAPLAAEAPVDARSWTTATDMITDLERRYPGAQFGDLAKLDFAITKPAMEQMDDLFTRFGAIPSFRGVRVTDKTSGTAIAVVKGLPGGQAGSAIFLPKPIWKDRATLEQFAAKQADPAFSTASAVLAKDATDLDGYTRSIITHEVGHEYMGISLHARFGAKGDDVRAAVDDWFAGAVKTFKTTHLSKYARTNPHELWGEAFTAAVGATPIQTPGTDALRAILDEFYPPAQTVVGPLLPANPKQVASSLTSRFKVWLDALPEDQQAAINKYTQGTASAINDLLRGTYTPQQAELSKALGVDLQAMVKSLDAAFEDVPKASDPQLVLASTRMDKPMVVYRGRSLDVIPEVGDLVTEPGFLSTTIDPAVAAKFSLGQTAAGKQAVVYRIALPKGTRGLWTDEKFAYSEGELILQRGSKFRVVGKTADVTLPIHEAPGAFEKVTVVDVVPEPKALVPEGPPIPAETNAFRPGDPQQYIIDPATPPLNAPLAEWSGFVPPEPPLPQLKATPEQIDAARKAGDEARIRWTAINADTPFAVSWSQKETTEALAAGYVSETLDGVHLISKNADDLNPLRDYLAVKGHTSDDDAFWAILGYDQEALDRIDTAATITKGKRLTAGVMVFEPDGRVWVLAPKNKFAGYENTVIKGGVDPGESAAAGALRELREESGLSAELDGFVGDYTNTDGTALTRMYVGHRTGGGPLFADQKETYRVRLLTGDEAKKALTRYGKPNERDQAILADALEAAVGKPPTATFVIPSAELDEFAAVTRPALVSPPAVPSRPEPPHDPRAFALEPIQQEPPPSTSFGYDHGAVMQQQNVFDLPPSDKFPVAQTKWTLPGGDVQPMFWKMEPHGDGTEHVFWMNSKKQIADPQQRFTVHVAQLVRFSDQIVTTPLRVNEALLDQVPKLREMLIAAGATKPSPKTLELTADQLHAFAASIKSDVPLGADPALFTTAPLVPPVPVVPLVTPVPVVDVLPDALAAPGLAMPPLAAAQIDTVTASKLRLTGSTIAAGDGVLTHTSTWEVGGKSAVFKTDQESAILTLFAAEMDLPAAGVSGRAAMAAAELNRLADLVELMPDVEGLEITPAAWTKLPVSIQKMLNDVSGNTSFGPASLTTDELLAVREMLNGTFPVIPLPPIVVSVPESLAYTAADVLPYTGQPWTNGVTHLGSTTGSFTQSGLGAIFDDMTKTYRVTSLHPEQARAIGGLYDLAGRAKGKGAQLAVPESLVSEDMAAALVAAGGERRAGLIVVSKEELDAFQTALLPPGPVAPVVAAAPVSSVPAGKGMKLLAGANAPDDSTISFAVNAMTGSGTPQAMKLSKYPTIGGGGIVWRRLGNTLEVHQVQTSSIEVIKAHLVRLGQLADTTPKIDGLRLVPGAVASIKGTDLDILLVDAGAKVYPGGYRLSREQLLSIRDKVLTDAGAAAPSPAVAVEPVLISPATVAEAKAMTYAEEQLKQGFTKFSWAEPGGSPVIVVQRNLSKQKVWSRTQGATDEGSRMAASVRHLMKLGEVDLPANPAIESIRFENLGQLPAPFVSMLQTAGATGTNEVLVLAREDAVSLAKALSADVNGSTVADAITVAIAPPAPPAALPGLLGLAGHDPVVLADLQKSVPPKTAEYANSWSQAFVTPSGPVTGYQYASADGTITYWVSLVAGPAVPDAAVQAAFLRQLQLSVGPVAMGFTELRIGTSAFVGQAGHDMRTFLLGLGAEQEAGDVVVKAPLAKAIEAHLVNGTDLLPLSDAIAAPIPPLNAVTAGAKMSQQFGYDSSLLTGWDSHTAAATFKPATGVVQMYSPAGGFEVHFDTGVTIAGQPMLILSTAASMPVTPTSEGMLASLFALRQGMDAKGASHLRVWTNAYSTPSTSVFHDVLLAAGGVEGAYGIDLDVTALDSLLGHMSTDSALHTLPKGSGAPHVPGVPGYNLSAVDPDAIGEGVIASGSGYAGDPYVVKWGDSGITTTWQHSPGDKSLWLWNGMSSGGVDEDTVVSVMVAQLHALADLVQPGESLRVTSGLIAAPHLPNLAKEVLGDILHGFGGQDVVPHIDINYDQLQALKSSIDNQLLSTPVTNVPVGAGPGGWLAGQMGEALTAIQNVGDYVAGGGELHGLDFHFGGANWGAGSVHKGDSILITKPNASMAVSPETSHAAAAAYTMFYAQQAGVQTKALVLSNSLLVDHPGLETLASAFGNPFEKNIRIEWDHLDDFTIALGDWDTASMAGSTAAAGAVAVTPAAVVTPPSGRIFNTSLVADALAPGGASETLFVNDLPELAQWGTVASKAANDYTVAWEMQNDYQHFTKVLGTPTSGSELSGMLAVMASSLKEIDEGASVKFLIQQTVLDETPGLAAFLQPYGQKVGDAFRIADPGASELLADLKAATAGIPSLAAAPTPSGVTSAIMPLHQKTGFDGALIKTYAPTYDSWPKYYYGGSYKFATTMSGAGAGKDWVSFYDARQKLRVLWYGTNPSVAVQAENVAAASWAHLQFLLTHAADADLPLVVAQNAARKAGPQIGDLLFQAGAKKKKFATYGESWVLDKAQVKKLLADMTGDPLVPIAKVAPGPSAAIDTVGKAALPSPAAAVAVGAAVPTPVAAVTISDTYGFSGDGLKAIASPKNDIEGATPHGSVYTSTITTTLGTTVGTVRWAEEKLGDAFVLHLRGATGPIGTGKATSLASALMAVFPDHMAGSKWTQLLVDKKALTDTKLGEMLAAFGAKETKTYYRLTVDQVTALSAALVKDEADWVGAAVVPKLAAAVPTTTVKLVAGVPQVPTPSFVYGFDSVQVKAWAADAPVKHTGLINTGETKDILSPLGSNAGLAWSVSPSGKAIGVFDVIAGANDAETRDAAFAMLRHVVSEGQARWTGSQQGERLFFKPDAYDKVPGLRQMLIDAGGKPTQYPKLGEAIELTPDQAAKLVNALTTDTLTGLTVSIAKTSEYLGFDSGSVEKLLTEVPATVPGGWQWVAAGDKVQTRVTIANGEAVFSGLAGGGATAHVAATVAELNHIADIGVNKVTITADVLGLVPKLDKFLLASGGSVVGDTMVLDAAALNRVRLAISKDALPVLLGGKPLPFSIIDELAANASDAVTAAQTVSVKGTTTVFTATIKGAAVDAKVTIGPSNLFWESIEVPAGATVGNVRAATATHLRSLINMAAQNGAVQTLDVSTTVFRDAPTLRAVLAKYGAREASSGKGTYLTLNRTQIAKLRTEMEAEIAAYTPVGTSYIGKQAIAIKWPTADELTAIPLVDPVTSKPLTGQTAKNLFSDKAGNQWLFKPGETGRGAATDEAAASLARLVGLPVPPVRRYTLLVNGKPVTGSLQKMVPNARSIKSLSELSNSQTSEMLRHSVLDWLTNNDDAHIGNWLVDPDGHLWAIDKTRSWTTLNDGAHDVLRTSNEGNGGGTPLLFKFWRDVAQDPSLLAKVKPQDLAPTLRAVRNMSDEEFLRIVRPVAEAMNRGKYAGKPDQMLAAMLARKHSVATDFEAYFKHEVDSLRRTRPAELPVAWKKWLDDGATFNLDATPEDLWHERRDELNAIFGVYSPGEYTRRAQAGHLGKVRSTITSYFGGGVSGSGSGKWGAELIRPRLSPAQEQEWRQLNEWAILNIVSDPTLEAPAYGQAAIMRKWFNPETGKVRLVRSTNRYSSAGGRLDDPKAYVAGMKKDGLRNMFGTAINTHVIVGAHGGVFYYLEVDPDQIFSWWGLGFGASAGESELLVADPRPEQVLHIRPQTNRMDLSEWLKWDGGPLYK